MKISKFIHSCVLFELEGYQLLFDPGIYTFAGDRVDPAVFKQVNSIIITHIHGDHFHLPTLRKVLEMSGAELYTNRQTGAELDKENIPYHLFESGDLKLGPFDIQAIPVTHAKLLNAPTPVMSAYVINGNILHPVDTLNSSELADFKGIELMLMVTMAPFAGEVSIAAFTEAMAPKQLFPLHDGYAQEGFIKARQANYKAYFAERGITFHELQKPGDSIEI